MEKNKISLVSLGCAKNLVDSEILIGGLKSEDYKISAVKYYLKSKHQTNTCEIFECSQRTTKYFTGLHLIFRMG